MGLTVEARGLGGGRLAIHPLRRLCYEGVLGPLAPMLILALVAYNLLGETRNLSYIPCLIIKYIYTNYEINLVISSLKHLNWPHR